MIISAPNSFQSRLLAARLHRHQNGPRACLCRQVNFTTKPVSGEICSFDVNMHMGYSLAQSQNALAPIPLPQKFSMPLVFTSKLKASFLL